MPHIRYGDGKASRALQKAALRGNTALVKAIIESTKGVDINHGSAPQDSGAQNEENMEIQDGYALCTVHCAFWDNILKGEIPLFFVGEM